MLLIDADNVSVDVMEQAVALLLDAHGAVHVRRAYGTAEAVVKNQAVFKRLSIRPMVNLSAGKNSTDIAMAVDAMDLVLAERPDIVVIVSSDSDFAPLVGRLREKGCRVLGIGQEGKTGDETQAAYDGYTVLAHRRSTAAAARAPATKRAPVARKAAAVKTAARTAAKTVVSAAAKKSGSGTVAKTAPKSTPAAKKVAAPRKTAVPSAGSASGRSAASAPTGVAAADAVTAAPTAPAAGAASPGTAAATVQQILQALPELAGGAKLQLRMVGERLRDAGLISRSGSLTKLLGRYAERFELTPAGQPNHVALRRAD